MFKKSVLIAALAISSTLGSEVVWNEQEKLAWVWLQIKASDPEGSVLNEYQRAQAAERMSGVVRVLISDPKSIETSPIQVITSGRVLMNLGCPNEAVIVLRFLLQLNSPTISAEKIMAASMLYELGQAELATPVIRLFINDKASTPEIRQAAIRAFYSMNPTVHRNEAREMMAQVCVESGEIATLEHARQSANVIFSTPEEREANRLERERARQAKIAQDINDKEESLRKAEEFVNHRANRLG